MSSDRVSVHFTGRPSFKAAAAATRYSTYIAAFGPNPPPTQGHTTRTCSGSRPSAGAIAACSGVRRLVRDPAGEAAGGLTGYGDEAVALHRHAGQALADHRDLGDLVGSFEGVDVVADVRGEADVRAVLGEQQRRLRRQRVAQGHDDGQRLVVDDDRLGGVDGLRLRLGHDGGDDVADEAHPLAGEDRAVERRAASSGSPGTAASPRSSPPAEYTATTPGIDAAAATSTDDTVPWAIGERTKATWHSAGDRRGRRCTWRLRSAAPGPPA